MCWLLWGKICPRQILVFPELLIAFRNRVGQAAKKVSRMKHFTTFTYGPPGPPSSYSPVQKLLPEKSITENQYSVIMKAIFAHWLKQLMEIAFNYSWRNSEEIDMNFRLMEHTHYLFSQNGIRKPYIYHLLGKNKLHVVQYVQYI